MSWLTHNLLSGLAYSSLHGPDIAPDGKHPERDDYRQVFLLGRLRDALNRINPDIPAECIDDAIRVITRTESPDLVTSNRRFHRFLTDGVDVEIPSPGTYGGVRHDKVWLLDLDDPDNNDFLAVDEFTVIEDNRNRRADIVIFVNGIPLAVFELKKPGDENATIRKAFQQLQTYKREIPSLFVPNEILVVSDGLEARSGTITSDWNRFMTWRTVDGRETASKNVAQLEVLIPGLFETRRLLDYILNFVLFEDDGATIAKKSAAYHQYWAVNKAVSCTFAACGIRTDESRLIGRFPAHRERDVVAEPTPLYQPSPKFNGRQIGVIWHTQGSGKSLSMVMYTGKIVRHPDMQNPTVVVITDRNDLDDQLFATFANCKDILRQSPVQADSRAHLRDLLRVASGGIVFTTIQKFMPEQNGDFLSDRKNIVVIADEAHRSQYDFIDGFARHLHDALPNAFLFGLTGTPINRSDRNTFWAFGAEEDEQGYLSRYSFQESIRDKATLPLHFEAVDVRLHIDKEAIDEAYAQITDDLSEQDRDDLAKRAAKMAVLIKAPARVKAICEHIANHYRTKVEPNGFKAQVVTFDRECCVLYKQALDEIMPPEASTIVMHTQGGKGDEYSAWKLGKDEEERLLDRFRDPNDPLKLLIVTSKLLTGFDAPILQTMYLDKPMRDHNLLQAICRTNRPFPNKTCGLIVDYLGIFDDVARALDFDEKSVLQVITNLDELKQELPGQVAKCLAFFPGVDRTVGGYEGLIAAQDCLPNNEVRDKFAAEFSVLSRLWEALSPDPVLNAFQTDYKWLAQVYQSVKPASGTGKLLWHSLGAKTIELVHQNVHLETVRDDLETLVMDAEVLQGILDAKDPRQKSKEVEIKLIARLRKHAGNPVFMALGERLEHLKEKHEQGLIHSLDFLKMLLDIAKDVLQAEKGVDPVDERHKAKTALTELFLEMRNGKTPVVIERIVEDIDEIVRLVRFPGWQDTNAGEREVKKALRRVLYIKYKIDDEELFEKAYGYIRQYY